MTFSIIGRCTRTGEVGVAAVTAMPAVGKLVSHAMGNVGAIATQALTNPYYGIDGLKLLAAGRDARGVLDELLRHDPQRQRRQVAVIARTGRGTAWTGNKTPHWHGDIVGEDFCAQGNRLTGSDVLQAVADVFKARPDMELAHRLLAAIDAGHARGGDRKGERSGTILVFANEEYPLWDIRVDDAHDPVAEMQRLFTIFKRELLPQVRKLPKRNQPEGRLTDEEEGIG